VPEQKAKTILTQILQVVIAVGVNPLQSLVKVYVEY